MANNVIDFGTAKLRLGDHLVRGTAADGMIRAIAITARDTVQTAHERHGTSSLVTAALGRLLMAGQMMGAMSKVDDELITLEVRGDGPIGVLTVTANNRGQAKGFARNPNAWLPLNAMGKLDVGGGIGRGTLGVVRDVPGAMPYASQTELITGEIGDDMAQYFRASDQVPTAVGVGVLVDGVGDVRQAGGFIVQLMPGYEYFLIDELEERLRDVTSVTNLLEQGMGPAELLDHILVGLDFEELEVTPAEFHCGCNGERAARATMALGAAEIEDMIKKGETAEVHCHFCGRNHYLTPDDLRELLSV